jgi:hypothetical protein
MAGKRTHDDGTGSDAPKKKKKRHAQEEQEQRPRGMRQLLHFLMVITALLVLLTAFREGLLLVSGN